MASEHVTCEEGGRRYPGRNMLVFISIFNFSVWSILTFQSQNYYSTAIGAKAFGNVPYVILQRFLLPLAIFFRFHAAVFSLILWKDYSHKDKTRSTLEREGNGPRHEWENGAKNCEKSYHNQII